VFTLEESALLAKMLRFLGWVLLAGCVALVVAWLRRLG
jgi:hypothetical protein